MDLKKLLLNEATFGVDYSKKELSINEPITLYLDGKQGGEIKRTDRDKPFKLTERGNLKTTAKVFYNSLNQEETKTIVYFCKNKKLKVGEKFGGLRPEDKKIFNEFCDSPIAKAVSKAVSIGGGNKPTISTTNKEHELKSDAGAKITIPNGAKIIPNKEKTGVAIKITEGQNQWVFFKCAGGVYIKDKVVYTASDDVLKNRLLKGFCQNKPQVTPERTPGSGSNALTTQSQTPTLIKQIQKTIGVAETGKLTDTEIQTIYDKLNPSAPVNVNEPEARAQTTSAKQAIQQLQNQTAPKQLAGVPPTTNSVSEEINRIKEMMGIVLNEQSTPTEPQPEKTPTIKLQELLNTKFSAGLTVDGKMGPKTAQAIINALGKATITTPTPSSTNQTSSGTPVDTKPTDDTSKEVKQSADYIKI
jgi:hypothetical protein